ncbi:hypothetical protein [Butyrivibrio sp. NC2002]|uniref:hypothetical protein n=1 Tax=Butyrivibrio sp. NC2002 TaxID=1410610 RepID=UPI00055A99CC|nr:hypothetical protein [Butyrivibrio sp. NC2002]
MNTKDMGYSDKTAKKAVIMILVMALVTAILQGNRFTAVVSGIPKQPQITILFLIGLFSIVYLAFCIKNKKMDTEKSVLWIVWSGMLMRIFYVLFYDIKTLQNDGGFYTGYGTPDINNGHIGYIEYIYKFHHLPSMDPYEYFGYYHPPLHHIIEAIWVSVQRFLHVYEDLAFENLQIPTLIYSGLCMVVMLKILEEAGAEKKYIPLGMILFAYHPRMMVLAGSVNNDILALLLLLTTIWRVLVWIRSKTYKNIILIALSLGCGMITKLNTAICAFSIAVVFLMALIRAFKNGNLLLRRNILLQYVVFGVICIPIGLSYIVRNLVLFSEKPGIPSPALIPNESVMYTGTYSVWSIIGIPSIADLHIEFPFHPISAEAMHNTWAIMFQTGLFAEAYPAGMGDSLVSVAQIAYVSSIIAAIITTVVFIYDYASRMIREAGKIKYSLPHPTDEELAKGVYKTDTVVNHLERTVFLLLTYIFMLISFSLFVFKYPYTCSSDFRYMTAGLVFTSLGFIIAVRKMNKGFWRFIRLLLVTAMAACLVGSLVVFMFWEI